MKNPQKKCKDPVSYEENVNLASVMLQGRKLSFRERVDAFHNLITRMNGSMQHTYFRSVQSRADREVTVKDDTGSVKKMLMFGSNNYLGLANHPHVVKKVTEAMEIYGVGIGGPPLLNGYTSVMQELEKRLSDLKGTEDTLIFSSGYNANVGLVTGLCTPNDVLLADEYSHASFFDGVKMLNGQCSTFRHNDVDQLQKLLVKHGSAGSSIFVAVEGVYSMDGDMAPLENIQPICKKHNAILLVDDAHGTGVIGENGGGIHDHFRLPAGEDIILGTFSKAFAVNGGFISASKPVINYLRLMSRSYMFSASLPPVTMAAALAGLDVLEKEPHLRQNLHDNVVYATRRLGKFGLASTPQAGIIAVKVPANVNIRNLAKQFHEAGIFLNSVEYPAVPLNKQRFRISIMANHTRQDIDTLALAFEEIWANNIYLNVA